MRALGPTLYGLVLFWWFWSLNEKRAVTIVRGNNGEKRGDLEILGIVEFSLFFVSRGRWGPIFAECHFLYPVAFFWAMGGGLSQELSRKWVVQNSKNEEKTLFMHRKWLQKKPQGKKIGIRQKRDPQDLWWPKITKTRLYPKFPGQPTIPPDYFETPSSVFTIFLYSRSILN